MTGPRPLRSALLAGAVSLTATAAHGQAAPDPLQLRNLQAVLGAALERVAPAVVRIETFGGTRRPLTGDGPGDAIATPRPTRPDDEPAFRYRPQDLEELFERIDPDELARLWADAGLEPKPADEPFAARDLQRLGEARLKALFRQHGVGPFAPDEDRGPGRLVQPGFLQAQGATTGLVLSADGWIVISRFALNFDPTTILVSLPDGRSFTARRAGEDTSRGIALVKIDATDLPTVDFVDPATVRVGAWAFALGRTFAPRGRPSVHAGIVSARDRLFGRAVQIDANTSPANYGGPVIDVHGRVLGIAVPLSPQGRDAGVDWYDSGIGFAATLHGQQELLERLQAGELLHRGWLGVQLRPDHLGPGAVLAAVADDSPAAGIGLQEGDLVVEAAGEAVRNAFHLQVLLGRHQAGDAVHLRYRRGDAAPTGVTAFLAELPSRERAARTRSEESFQLPWEGDPDPPPGGGR